MKNRYFLFSAGILLFFLTNIISLNAQEHEVNKNSEKSSNEGRRGKNADREKKSSPIILIEKIMTDMSSQERARLSELQQSDPKAFRKEIGKIVKKYRVENSKKDPELKKLIKAYNSASDEEKEEIKKQITDSVSKHFNKKMDANRKNYKKAAKRLEDLKRKLNEREQNAALIIEARVKQLIQKRATHQKNHKIKN